MAGEITVTVTGNLTDDPALRYTPSGTPVCNFRVAQTPRSYDRDSGKWRDGEAVFLTCNAWRDMAEHVAESLTKGARVIVAGRLRQRTYETSTGEKRTVMEVDVDDVGASLRYTAAKVARLDRPAPATSSQDQWAAEPADEPPF